MTDVTPPPTSDTVQVDLLEGRLVLCSIERPALDRCVRSLISSAIYPPGEVFCFSKTASEEDCSLVLSPDMLETSLRNEGLVHGEQLRAIHVNEGHEAIGMLLDRYIYIYIYSGDRDTVSGCV